ncbi:acyl-CoA dehydrogenase family protein [Nocardia jinanensis]|uniref:Acyl-CoA dehydrogenase n=1 Tax=Nocardia jinanensis TaxID=382504 RepID=A0A917RLH8_9NOCA|nr:acyl-CoA dehydrogenase family protein [Nocardia jinanensis]GGL12672.1 acyl-CoA dehydrogenase [Nocardia jinanensis]
MELVALRDLPAAVSRWQTDHGSTAREHCARALAPQRALPSLRAQKDFHAWLYEQGWLAQGWPAELGGLGGDVLTRTAVYDELGQRGIFVPTTVNSVEVIAPMLLKYAPDLAREHLPALISGREAWCQGFSEPEAGSDLAALRLRAAPADGDGWILSGQKVWSTRAVGADRCVVLARTGAPESRHRGLSLFLVDMTAAGLDCRPIGDMTGTEHFGELFFDAVRVPADRLIGTVDHGWEAAMYLFQWERGVFAWLRQAVLHATLRGLDAGGERWGLERFGSAYQDVTALRLRSLATIRALAAGRSSGPQVSVDKLLLSRAERSVQDLSDLLRPVAIDDGAPDRDERVHDFLHSRSASIYGGSAEVQRTIVATQILGLPRGR